MMVFSHMTHILHQLRARSSAISRSLLLVLLAAWLSMVCPPCLTLAQAAPVPTIPPHTQKAPPAGHQSGTPDCCQDVQAGPCAEESCGAVKASTTSAPAAALIASSEPPFVFIPTVDASYVDDTLRQQPTEPLRMSAADDGPLYLRHCCFLN